MLRLLRAKVHHPVDTVGQLGGCSSDVLGSPPHSHSIVFEQSYRLEIPGQNSLACNQAPSPLDLQKFAPLIFARQFTRFQICSVSATIGINRSIFDISRNDYPRNGRKNTVPHHREQK
jgi:hypothetical protein